MTVELYHVTALKRLNNILRNGFSRFEEPLSRELVREEVGVEGDEEEESFRDCSSDAQYEMNEFMGRSDNVYFWTDLDRAYESMYGVRDLGLDLVVTVVDAKMLPCNCTVDECKIADDIFDEFYSACLNDSVVDDEKLERLLEEWLKTEAPFDPNKIYPDSYEVKCPCDIPKEAILYVLDRNRNIVREAANLDDVKEIIKAKLGTRVAEITEVPPAIPESPDIILISCGRCDRCKALEAVLKSYGIGRIIDWKLPEAKQLLATVGQTLLLSFLHPLLIANGDPQLQFSDKVITADVFANWFEDYYDVEISEVVRE